ncbi:CHAT domain-containing protein [Streptomyces sp. NPDC005017]|uniref:CHAT domain-containing protein n=1 Tax=Streptomyces sp. NPDC005017 TaxID=3364706 RepID=UPI0036A2BB51
MRHGVVAMLVATAIAVSLLSPARHEELAPAADSQPALSAANYAVALDISASVTPEDLEAETDAVKRIALGDVSSSSTVSVFGFASADRAGQSAVEPLCPRTVLDGPGRESVAECVDGFRGREEGQGTGTDFPSAIRQGVEDLADSDSLEPKVLFLLTDGKLDIRDSPMYGEDVVSRDSEAARQLSLALAEARAQKVQVWPLGFGPWADRQQLASIAAGGYQVGCVGLLPASSPTASMVQGAEEIGATLQNMFAAAQCSQRHVEGPSERPPASMEIDVSPLATSATLVVDKGDPAVRITYVDPRGDEVPKSGWHKKSRVELAGGTGTVEALRISDPLPGTWTVRTEAPEGHRSRPVSVSLLWRGEVLGAIVMDPLSPRPGEKVTVTLRLQTREGYAIKDPADYAGLRIRAELTGDGFSPRRIGFIARGQDPYVETDLGFFPASLTVPDTATGALRVGVDLTAPGLTTDTRPLVTAVASGEQPTEAGLRLSRPKSHAGGEIAAKLTVRNTATVPHTLRLSIEDILPGLLSITPNEITVAPGEQSTWEVTVRVASADAFGDRLGEGLRLVGTYVVTDATDYNRMLFRSAESIWVTPEPGPWLRYPTLYPAALLTALCAAGVLMLVRQRVTAAAPSGQPTPAPTQERDPRGRALRTQDDRQGSGWEWVDEPLPSPRAETSPPREPDPPPAQTIPRPTVPDSDPDTAEPRSLVAELVEQIAPGREMPLQVQIVRGSTRGTGVQLRPFALPRGGARVVVTIHAPGLTVLDELQKELHVVPGRDSDVLRFRLKASMPGLHQVTVRAYRGGTFLGGVVCQVSVGHGSVTRDGPQRQASLPSMASDPGEVTLQVLKDKAAGTISFQLLAEATTYLPETISGAAGFRGATEQIYAELRRAAKAAADGSDVDARRLRNRLRNQGVQLWTSAVPDAVQRQFWTEADRFSAITVVGEHDSIPWELLYPLDEHREDRGFLAEWLPVVRHVHNHERVRSLSLPGVAFVVPPDSPADATTEVASLRARLGSSVADAGVLTEGAALAALVQDGHAGLLHFACHNSFTGSGSCVKMADGDFDPVDLAAAAKLRALRPHRPLVFFNACRSAGEITWFGESLGWAPQFLNAGAGAFIGTLWPVRSRSALQFAEAFYEQFITHGQPLGQASLAARQITRELHGGDPTWLAYAVYGSPAATAHTVTREEPVS